MVNSLKKYKKALPGFVFAAFSLWIYWSALGIRVISRTRFNSTVMPKIVAVLMLLLSLALIVSEVMKARKTGGVEKSRAAPAGNAPRAGIPSRKAKIVCTFIPLVVYATFLEVVGFLITTTVYLFAQMLVMAPRGWKTAITITLLAPCTAGGIYCLFYYGFKLMLPVGILG